MNEPKCCQCRKVLFSKDRVYSRFCCNALFHQECIRQDHMRVCPTCQCFSNETLSWVPVCVVNDSEDEPPTKRRKIETDDCVICFERGTETNEVLTTKCCNQKGHVSCLRRYYNLPAESRSRRRRKQIAEELGIPNCFVCRGERENIVPLDRDVLEAILPEVRKKPRVLDADYANGALVAWNQLSKRMVSDLTLNRLNLYSLDAGTVKVRYENGVVKSERLPRLGDRTRNAMFRTKLHRRLTEMGYRWAGLPPMAKAFDQHTCRYFSLRGIDEIVLHLTISHYQRRAKRSTRPDAPPFAVEYEETKIATWTCTGHYFDFGDVDYDEVDEGNPYSVRLSDWHYDFDQTQTDTSKCRNCTGNIVKKNDA